MLFSRSPLPLADDESTTLPGDIAASMSMALVWRAAAAGLAVLARSQGFPLPVWAGGRGQEPASATQRYPLGMTNQQQYVVAAGDSIDNQITSWTSDTTARIVALRKSSSVCWLVLLVCSPGGRICPLDPHVDPTACRPLSFLVFMAAAFNLFFMAAAVPCCC